MKIENWPIDRIRPYERNPRKNVDAVEKVARSLAEFGWQQPLVVDSDGVLIAGHTRLKAAQSLGWTEAPVHVAAALTAEQAKAYRIADNRTGEEATWDQDRLVRELIELELSGASLASTGFDDAELDALLRRTPKLEGTEPPAPEIPETPRTKPGDVVTLGNHVLVCGDSTARATVDKATQSRAVGALVFDPPFERDDLIASADLDQYEPNDILVFGDCMNPTHRHIDTHLPWRFGFVWDGVTRWMVPGRPLLAHKTCDWFGTSAYDHDAVKDPRKVDTKPLKGRNSRGEYELEADPRGKSLASVFRSPVTAESHGAEHSKPVVWLAMLIGNCTRGLVLDLFAGSGTSLLACEEIKRPWCGVELNPAYCDVIVARWEQATGQQAVYQASPAGAKTGKAAA